jgi:D-glycero-alpha-D-manno-heptose 1-phosphate guanylyltransferase
MKDCPPCVVLAGGLGTRLRSVVADRPKCLSPVGDRSFLRIQLESLAARGIDRFVLSLGHMAEAVIDALPTLAAAAMQVDFLVEPQPLGTGGALLYAMDRLGLDEVLAANGDTFVDADLHALLRPLDRDVGESMRVAAVAVDDRARYGGLALDGSRIGGFVEKGSPGPGWINAGLYRLGRGAFDGLRPGTAFSLESAVMPALAAQGRLHVARLSGSFIDIGVPDDYHRFCSERS